MLLCHLSFFCLQDIIGRFPDLIDGFTRFLQHMSVTVI
jgi:hypothetical protein